MLYKKSPFLSFEKSGQGYVMANLITGKRFSIGKDIYLFINSFDQGKELSNKDDDTIDFLIEKRILLDVNNFSNATYVTTLKKERILGLEERDIDQQCISKEVVFIGVPFGRGNPKSNYCSDFPAELRRICKELKIDINSKTRLSNSFLAQHRLEQGYLNSHIKNNKIKDGGDIFIHDYESRKTVYKKIEYINDDIVKKSIIPFYLGGDHSITLPILKSLCNYYKRINVLHFDAHLDIYNDKFTKILDSENLHNHGNFVSKILDNGAINKYYQFGIRGLENMRFNNDHHEKLEIYWKGEESNHKFDDLLSNDIPCYITFDIDFFDPIIAPATATPVNSGFFYEEFLDLVYPLLKNKKIIGLDLVEVNPGKDNQQATTRLAIGVILNLINMIKI